MSLSPRNPPPPFFFLFWLRGGREAEREEEEEASRARLLPRACSDACTYLWQTSYGGCLEQGLAHAADDPELLLLLLLLLLPCHLGTVLLEEAIAAVASAHGVGVDGGDVFWAVEDAEGRHDDEVPHVAREV